MEGVPVTTRIVQIFQYYLCYLFSTHTHTHLWGALLQQSPDWNGSAKPNGFWRWLGINISLKNKNRSNSQFMLGTFFYITKSQFT